MIKELKLPWINSINNKSEKAYNVHALMVEIMLMSTLTMQFVNTINLLCNMFVTTLIYLNFFRTNIELSYLGKWGQDNS